MSGVGRSPRSRARARVLACASYWPAIAGASSASPAGPWPVSSFRFTQTERRRTENAMFMTLHVSAARALRRAGLQRSQPATLLGLSASTSAAWPRHTSPAAAASRPTRTATSTWRDAQGSLHREDGPAVQRTDGGREWYRDGWYHREDLDRSPRRVISDVTDRDILRPSSHMSPTELIRTSRVQASQTSSAPADPSTRS
jgi:hypothetical protein